MEENLFHTLFFLLSLSSFSLSCFSLNFRISNHFSSSNFHTFLATAEVTTIPPEETEGSGCYVEGEHYKEGAQMPSDPTKPCEVCYCIRNTSSCVVQECTLKVAGCQPLFSSDSCCPTRYNCCKFTIICSD